MRTLELVSTDGFPLHVTFESEPRPSTEKAKRMVREWDANHPTKRARRVSVTEEKERGMKRVSDPCRSQAARFLLAVAIALSAGCASQGGLKNVSQESYGSKPSAQSLVIGTLDVKNPKELGLRMPKLFSGGNKFILARTSPAGVDSANLFHDVAWGAGDFYVLLDPGKYRIVRVEGPISTLSRSGNFTIPVDLPFEVPENKIIYIGAVEVKFTLTLGGRIEDLKVTVLDEYDDAVKKFGEKYSFIGKPVENRTMKTQ